MTEWFSRWFGEDYLKLYPHRDDADARRLVDLISREVPLTGRRVLDLACGPGRHSVALAAHGARVVGYDLSRVLLERASRGEPPVAALIRGDMRALPFAAASFDVVVNLFTSFGYFATDREHRSVLVAVGGALVPSGDFVMDYLNSDHVRAHLVTREVTETAGRNVEITRQLVDGDRFVRKTMHVVEDGDTFVEQVRLFAPEDLIDMFHTAGLEVREQFGDYDGQSWSPASPRTLLFARKT